MQFLILGHEDFAQAAFGVRAQHPVARPGLGRPETDGLVHVRSSGQRGQAGLHVRVGDLGQQPTGTAGRIERGQAMLGIPMSGQLLR